MKIATEIAAIIKEELSQSANISFDHNGINETTNLIEAGMLDSFGLVELIGFLESCFKIRLHDDDLISSEIVSVQGMVRLVQKRQI